MLRGLRTALYPAPDLERAKAFYTALLGFEPYFDQPFYVGYEVAGYELGLVPDGTPAKTGVSALWGVDAMEPVVARLRELGAPILEEPHEVGDGIIVAAGEDPLGNRIGLIYNPHFRAEVGSRMAATGAEASPRMIEVAVTVPKPRDEVWRLWTRQDEVATWFGSACRVELRVGGPFEIYFLPKPGMRGSEGCRFLSFIEPRMLSFTWNAPPGMKTRLDHTVVVVELEAVSDGTRVKLTHTGWPAAGLEDPSSEWKETFDYFAEAWVGVLEDLEARCR